MSYLRAVLNNNKSNEIKYLKHLVLYGEKLRLDTNRYEKELKKHNQPVLKKQTLKKKYTSTKLNKYSINSVTTDENSIRIDFNHYVSKKDLKFFELKYKNLNKDVFDIKGRFKDARPTKLRIDGINKISISQYKYNTLRITLSHKFDLNTYYIINRKSIIIKINKLKKNSKTSKTTLVKNTVRVLSPSRNSHNQKRVIVIDAGHGGKDVGAVGPNKRYEKNAVLKISKYLYQTLRLRGYKVYLTRNGDRFIKVHNRTKLTNAKKADIFISVHANAAQKSRVKKARGIETFFLSPARTERAKRVAASENRSDMRKMSYSSKNSLLTILNQSKITQSNKLAIDIQQNILNSARSRHRDVVDGGVREGPFWVLVGAQMPAILVEVGYISHPTESKRLYSTYYQKLLANGIANGVDSYFLKNR
ncbi:MAG: N-acetylmuramoyl-L-alanine amidase [Campylobacteraceae bacterium]|nr:N-acetylmuramoyl-L-alanine amidase [Campylobacteraceae bacterium]